MGVHFLRADFRSGSGWPYLRKVQDPAPGKSNRFVVERVEPLPERAAREVQLSLVSRITAPAYRPPVLAAVAVQLIELSKRQNVSTREIANLIEQDPVLAADMLRVSQSALYALSSPIRSVDEALIRLGVRRSTELFVLAALKSKLFRCRGYETVLERLRKHCVATAEISRIIGEMAYGNTDAYLVALLHDVGIAGCVLALASKGVHLPPPPFALAWPAIRGLHQRFALHLTASWQLPKEIRSALIAHYGFEQVDQPTSMSAVTVLSEALAKRVGYGFEDEFNENAITRAVEQIGLSSQQLSQIEQSARELTLRLE